MSGAVRIKRGFVDLPHGQMHYRAGGAGEPIVGLHMSPASSRQMEGFINSFADIGYVVAPDTAGNGDSEALFDREPTVPELAESVLGVMDQLGLQRVRLFGTHTGAAIAAEVALMAPERVSHVVLDGIDERTPESLEEVLQHYANPFTPDQDGSYLTRIFQFCRDQYLFFPWYKRTKENQRIGGLPPAADLHAFALEVIKSCETYHRNYHAAFKWKARERLPLMQVPTLLACSLSDPLHDTTKGLLEVTANGQFVSFPRFDDPTYVAERKRIMAAFFDTPSPQ